MISLTRCICSRGVLSIGRAVCKNSNRHVGKFVNRDSVDCAERSDQAMNEAKLKKTTTYDEQNCLRNQKNQAKARLKERKAG